MAGCDKLTNNNYIMATLEKGYKVGRFAVQTLIKENDYTETYRVEDQEGNPWFMKLFVMKRLPERMVGEDGTVTEISQARRIKHKNIVSFVDGGKLDTPDGECQYYVTNYLSGELLSSRIKLEGHIVEEDALAIYRSIIEALGSLHAMDLNHNDITPRNIMLPAASGVGPQIIDLGHVSPVCSGRVPFDTADIELLYSSNETFAGIYDPQCDIFSATAVLYAMLTGGAPWAMEFADSMKRTRRAMLLKEKRKAEPLDIDSMQVSDRTKAILVKGLAPAYNDRYRKVEDVIADLCSDEEPTVPEQRQQHQESDDQPRSDGGDRGQRNGSESPNAVQFEIQRGGGNGFSDIAGMADLKAYLEQHIIFVIKNKEKMARYRLTPPNGMLLYGPPGCGKTFVAEKFAEQTQFNFILVKASDLASSFVHGSQEKIAQLFDQAAKNAPIVLCFDEFDALVPDRSNPAAQYSAGEVNEFLSQLNNCSERGIFVVATTNRPDKIDPAVLRTGRIDKRVYVPLPDHDARSEMFRIHLKGRPCDMEAIDFSHLADITDGFIASDIACVVNDAAMVAAYTDQDITQQLIESSISSTHPSLLPDVMTIYEDLRRRMEYSERSDESRRTIGFHQKNA